MWTRFAPRLRRAIGRALVIAGQQNCTDASAAHLLLAIIADEQSGGAIVLQRCGVSPDRVAERMEADADCKLPQAADQSPDARAKRVSPDFLHLLDIATAQANRYRHDHVGTEHVAMALARSPHVRAGTVLQEMGLSAESADAAAIAWLAEGMPRTRPKIARRGSARWWGRPWKLASAGWDIVVRKSLAHPRYVTNPYPLYRWLREHHPVRKDPLAPVWVLTRYDDVAMMLRDPRFRKDPFAAERLPPEVGRQLGIAADRVDQPHISMLFLDPPQHTRVRSVFARYFTPATLAALRPRIELICRDRLERVKGCQQIDLIADLAYPLPVMVIAEILGFDATDYVKFKEWSDAMAASLMMNAKEETHIKAAEARDHMREYFNHLVPRLQKSPNDSLLSRLLEAEGAPEGLTREEIFTNCVLLMAAGHETTTNLIGNGILALMRQRDQWEAIVADPTLIDSAVEEMLRFDSPVQWTSRATNEPTTIGNVTIPEGEIVLGCVGAANRDPEKFTNPDRFDLHRKEAKHLSFGLGAHYCLGAALAPMEAAIALAALVERYPRLRLVRNKQHWMKGLTFRGVTSLPLRVD
jgi:pimeloyl-[acyl-carrier protein] synthase